MITAPAPGTPMGELPVKSQAHVCIAPSVAQFCFHSKKPKTRTPYMGLVYVYFVPINGDVWSTACNAVQRQVGAARVGQLNSSDCAGFARTTRGCKRKYDCQLKSLSAVSNLRSERFGHHHVNCFAKACAPQIGLKLYAGGKGEEGRNEGANCATRKYWCNKAARAPRSPKGKRCHGCMLASK